LVPGLAKVDCLALVRQIAGAVPLPESSASMEDTSPGSGHRSTVHGHGTAHPSRGRRLSVGGRAVGTASLGPDISTESV